MESTTIKQKVYVSSLPAPFSYSLVGCAVQHIGNKQILAQQCCLEEERSAGPPALGAVEGREAWGWPDKKGEKTP